MSKNVKIIAIILCVIGIIVTAIFGFNVGLKYRSHKKIGINIAKEFNREDVRKIFEEVFPGKETIIQEIEIYKDMIQVTITDEVGDLTEEQKQELIDKINKKYELELTTSYVLETYTPNYRIRDMVRPYIMPVMLSIVISILYLMIVYRKLKPLNVLYRALECIILTEGVFFSLYAITRLEVNGLTMPLSVILLMFVLIVTGISFNKEQEKLQEKKDKK